MRRREFLGALLGAPALVGLARKGGGRAIAGGFVEDDMAAGHALRDRRVPGSSRAPRRRISTVIVGGGIAGLSSAWELERRGMRDFVLLELAPRAGGNARSGENAVSAYPWAAHYVPVPGPGATLVRELFEELGVLKNGVWEERHLCFSPQERLFVHGEWQPGIEPEFALPAREREQFRRFDELIAAQRETGAFTIPSALGAGGAEQLDRLTMHEWLERNSLDSPALRWYVDYACRDDYGALARDVSAWAGVHYFASRDHEEPGPLTWPEGNGWIVKRLLERLGPYVRTRAPASRVERSGTRWLVHEPSALWECETVIFAAPRFVAPYVIDDLRERPPGFVYSPWMVANLTLDRWPRERGAPPAWDNVIYGSPGLGYVVATHQSLRTVTTPTVWTYYWAVAEHTPRDGRLMLARRSWEEWRDRILADLARAHPDIRECVSRIDVLRLAHAMVRPTPGFRGAPARRDRALESQGLWLAHSDASGLSLFEEAQYEGVRAARRVLARLGRA